MIHAVKAEFLKIFTVRSTYIMLILSAIFIAAMSFYFEGVKGNTGSPASMLTPEAFQSLATSTAGLIAVFATIIAILLMAHEYRYNTITYTLTSNTSRTQVLISKTIAVTIFGVLFGLAAVLLSIGSYYVGLGIRGVELPPQDFNLVYNFGKVVMYFAVYSLVGLILATILKSVVGAIAFFFIVPITVESLLGIVLKDNAAYLPFTMFDSILGNGILQSNFSTTKILILSAVYIVVAWVISWVVFLRRDAS